MNYNQVMELMQSPSFFPGKEAEVAIAYKLFDMDDKMVKVQLNILQHMSLTDVCIMMLASSHWYCSFRLMLGTRWLSIVKYLIMNLSPRGVGNVPEDLQSFRVGPILQEKQRLNPKRVANSLFFYVRPSDSFSIGDNPVCTREAMEIPSHAVITNLRYEYVVGLGRNAFKGREVYPNAEMHSHKGIDPRWFQWYPMVNSALKLFFQWQTTQMDRTLLVTSAVNPLATKFLKANEPLISCGTKRSHPGEIVRDNDSRDEDFSPAQKRPRVTTMDIQTARLVNKWSQQDKSKDVIVIEEMMMDDIEENVVQARKDKNEVINLISDDEEEEEEVPLQGHPVLASTYCGISIEGDSVASSSEEEEEEAMDIAPTDGDSSEIPLEEQLLVLPLIVELPKEKGNAAPIDQLAVDEETPNDGWNVHSGPLLDSGPGSDDEENDDNDDNEPQLPLFEQANVEPVIIPLPERPPVEMDADYGKLDMEYEQPWVSMEDSLDDLPAPLLPAPKGDSLLIVISTHGKKPSGKSFPGDARNTLTASYIHYDSARLIDAGA